MHKLFRWIYFLWISFWFILGFLLIYPFILVIIQRKAWHKYYYHLTYFWAYLFYTMIFVPVKRTWHFKPNRRQPYVFCPNHFSYMDIPLLTLTMPSFFIFVGLHNLQTIPLFGYMYRKIHITVDRSNLRDRYRTFQRAKQALKEGKNLVIFPEGGIWSEHFPELAKFKDGPFRVAIEQQVPIIPVTIPYNWKLMPLFDFSRLRWHRQEVIYHAPIDTQGLTLEDIPQIKQETYRVIQGQLNSHFG